MGVIPQPGDFKLLSASHLFTDELHIDATSQVAGEFRRTYTLVLTTRDGPMCLLTWDNGGGKVISVEPDPDIMFVIWLLARREGALAKEGWI